MATSTTARPRVLIWAAAIVVVVALLSWFFIRVLPALTAGPFTGQSLYTDPDSSVAKAVASSGDAAALAPLPTTPTAIWLLPEAHPTASVASFVDGVAKAAEAAEQMPVFVIYGIPDRDCNNESAGGLTDAEYPGWVSAIAQGLAGHKTAVILEPDSLALSVSCGNTDARVEQIRDAVSRLNAADSTVTATDMSIYLDGGHSTWLDVATQSQLLQRAGIENVRGFATNVSNFNTTQSERDYDEQVSAQTGGSHYVIDTSRNGNGTNGEWCNPAGRKIGDAPGAVSDGSKQDANLWIKNPGESDGECNGAPAAGAWWNDGALALIAG